MDQTVVTYFFYGVTYALIIAVLSLCVMALLVSRQLRVLSERRDIYHEDDEGSKKKSLGILGELREVARKHIEGSGIKLSLNEFMSIWAACTAVPPLIGIVMGMDALIVMLFAALGAFIPLFTLSFRKKHSEKRFEELLGQTMPLISSNLRGGAMLSQAIRPVAENMDEPIKGEFERLRRDMDRGMPVDKALDKMAERNNSSDLKLFASAVRAQMRTGGSLADIVDSVGNTIQQRCELRQMVRSRTSQARFTAILMVCVPPSLGIVFYLGNDMYREFYSSFTGLLVILLCALLEILGYVIANKMLDIRTD